MKQRLLIAQAVMNHPKIVILDEPTAGLDPKERIRIRNIVSQIGKDKIVLFATHVVSDIEHIAKQVILLKKGSVIAQDTIHQLCQNLKGKVFEVPYQEDKQYPGVISNIMVRADGTYARIICDDIQGICVSAELEDVYLAYFEEEGNRL